MANLKSILLFTPNMKNSTPYLSFKLAYNLNMPTYYVIWQEKYKGNEVMGEERERAEKLSKRLGSFLVFLD